VPPLRDLLGRLQGRSLTVDLTRLQSLVAERSDALRALAALQAELQAELRALRADGVPKTHLAQLAGVSRPTLDDWLRG